VVELLLVLVRGLVEVVEVVVVEELEGLVVPFVCGIGA
jgi:hypothetical protein